MSARAVWQPSSRVRSSTSTPTAVARGASICRRPRTRTLRARPWPGRWASGATSGTGNPATTLGASLASRGKTLLVLDGADGCVAPLGRALTEWLGAAPQLRWIVTSRTRLGIEGEAVLDLGPLGVVATSGGAPDAVWLFIDRARAARVDLVLDERTSRDVLELVRRLDGVPLAIELAAASDSVSHAGADARAGVEPLRPARLERTSRRPPPLDAEGGDRHVVGATGGLAEGRADAALDLRRGLRRRRGRGRARSLRLTRAGIARSTRSRRCAIDRC